MTDAELRDAAWAELKQTTTGWNRVSKYDAATLATTHWGKGKALLDRIGTQAPPPPPPPSGSWPPANAYVASDWSKGIVAPWAHVGNDADIQIVDCPWRAGEKALSLSAGQGALPPGGDPNTGTLTSTLTAVYCPQASGVSHALPGQETFERLEVMWPQACQFSSGNWNDFDEHHPTFTGAYGNFLSILCDPQPGENAGTSLLPGVNPRLYAAVRGGVKDTTGEFRRYYTGPQIQLGRKYDVLKHWRWGDSQDDNPLFELYLDGQLMWSTATPNLYTVDPRENYGMYAYVRNFNGRMTVLYGRVAVGPTAASVGGMVPLP